MKHKFILSFSFAIIPATEQRFSPEFARMYEQSPKVRVGDIELGRDLAEERRSHWGDQLTTVLTVPIVLTAFILHNLNPIGGVVAGLVAGAVLEVLNGGMEVKRSEREDIYQKE